MCGDVQPPDDCVLQNAETRGTYGAAALGICGQRRGSVLPRGHDGRGKTRGGAVVLQLTGRNHHRDVRPRHGNGQRERAYGRPCGRARAFGGLLPRVRQGGQERRLRPFDCDLEPRRHGAPQADGQKKPGLAHGRVRALPLVQKAADARLYGRRTGGVPRMRRVRRPEERRRNRLSRTRRGSGHLVHTEKPADVYALRGGTATGRLIQQGMPKRLWKECVGSKRHLRNLGSARTGTAHHHPRRLVEKPP